MPPTNEHAVQVLNSLIETTFDSAQSYGKAADLARNPRFQDGASGAETFIERDRDTVVRISIKSVGIGMADGGSLQVCIDIDGKSAGGQDGPAEIEAQLRASQSVQVLVKAGQRLAFKVYPKATDAHVLRSIVWTADMTHDADRGAESQKPDHAPNGHPAAEQPVN
jgi:hypothetical protein